MKVNYFNEKDIKKVNILLRTLHDKDSDITVINLYLSVNELFRFV